MVEADSAPLLDREDFANVWRDRPGLVPVSVIREAAQIRWLDIGAFHLYEGRYRTAIDAFRTMMAITGNNETFECRTPLDDLTGVPREEGQLDPSLVIFHLSRCGSTLLTKVLARSRSVIAIGESGLEIALWQHYSGNNPRGFNPTGEQRTAMKQAMSVFGRQRGLQYRHLVVKPTSAATMLMNVYRHIYPETVFYYVYRDPVEVLASQIARPIGYARHRGDGWGDFLSGVSDSGTLSEAEFLIACMQRNMSAALGADGGATYFIDHRGLNAGNLDLLLELADLDIPKTDREQMSREFGFYSKGFGTRKSYADDSAEKRSALGNNLIEQVERELGPLYEALRERTNEELRG